MVMRMSKDKHGNRRNAGRPDHVGSDINYYLARNLAVNYGLVAIRSLPPGIAKKVARIKALPPGIAKKTLPALMLNELPYYPGYEWRAVGDDLVLIALSTAVMTAVINGFSINLQNFFERIYFPGGAPVTRLNAFLKALSDSYPSAAETPEIVSPEFCRRSLASSILHCVRDSMGVIPTV